MGGVPSTCFLSFGLFLAVVYSKTPQAIRERARIRGEVGREHKHLLLF